MTQLDIPLPELLRRVEAGQIPLSARVQVWFEQPALNQTTLALLEKWAQEDAHLSPEEREEDERLFTHIEESGIERMRVEK